MIHLKWNSDHISEREKCYMFWNNSSDKLPFILPKSIIESVTDSGETIDFIFPDWIIDKEFDYKLDDRYVSVYGNWFNKIKQSRKCISIERK